MNDLTIREHMALHLAGQRFRYEAVRDTRAHDELGWTPVRYSQVVDALLDRPEALAAAPMVVGRLRRVREARRRVRTKPA